MLPLRFVNHGTGTINLTNLKDTALLGSIIDYRSMKYLRPYIATLNRFYHVKMVSTRSKRSAEEPAGRPAASSPNDDGKPLASWPTKLVNPLWPFRALLFAMICFGMAYKPPNENEFEIGQKHKDKNKRHFTSRRALFKSDEYKDDESTKFLTQVSNFLDNDVYHPPANGFIHGLPLILFADGFPSAMGPIVGMVLLLYPLLHYGMALWAYIAGYLDGDGSICGQLGEIKRPTISLCIPADTKLSELLSHIGFRRNGGNMLLTFNKDNFYQTMQSTGISLAAQREVDIARCTIVWGLTRFLVFKRLQWLVLVFLAYPARLFLDHVTTPLARYTRVVIPYILSHLNYGHGAGMGVAVFYKWLLNIGKFSPGTSLLPSSFNPLVEYVPIFLFLYIAGMFGSDGSVGGYSTKSSREGQCEIYQSCENYLLALVKILNKVIKFPLGEKLKVNKKVRQATTSAATRAQYYIRFSLCQVVRIIFPIGSFDYNRRSQWTVLLILIMVKLDNDIPKKDKDKIMLFLKDLLIIIKIIHPSYTYIIVIAITNAVISM